MLKRLGLKIWQKAPFFMLLLLFFVCGTKIYLATAATITGYKIGKAKQLEAELLESQSSLKMELALLSSKESLLELSHNAREQCDQWAIH